MSKIVDGANVVTIIDGKMLYGTVLRVHEELDLAIVQTEDGSIHKIKRDRLSITEKVREVPNEEPKEEPKPESNEDVKVITKEAFNDAVISATDYKRLMNLFDIEDPLLASLKSNSAVAVLHSIRGDLFGDKNEIEISKEELRNAIKVGNSPTSIVKSVDGSMNIFDAFRISMENLSVITTIPDILFGESENV